MAASIGFALLAAILASLAMQVQRRALARLDDLTGTFITVATIAVMFWIVSGWRLTWDQWRSPATPYFVAAGVLFPAMGQRMQILSTKHVGPALTAAFGAFLPFFAAVPSVLFLGEVLTLQQLFGITLLVGALLIAAVARGVDWRNRAFYLLALPLCAALARAIGMPIAKAGYTHLPDPFFAMIVMASVSTVVILAMMAASPARRTVRPVGRGHALFCVNGILIGVAILAIQLSLVSGPVAITTSLISTVPIWTLALGAFVFKTESPFWWHGVVAASVCVGAVLIVTGATSA